MGDVVTIHEDLEAMAEYKAMRAAHERWQAKKTARRRSLRFWLNWRQVTTVADIGGTWEPLPRGNERPSGVPPVSGVVGTLPPVPPTGASGAQHSIPSPPPRLPDNPRMSHAAGIRFM